MSSWRKLWWTRLWVIVSVVLISISAGRVLWLIYEGDYVQATEDMVQIVEPCDLAMTCDQRIDPKDEQMDQADS
jgi:hypothetical protein